MTTLYQYFQVYFQNSSKISFVVAYVTVSQVFILQVKKKIESCECWTFPKSQVGLILFSAIIINTCFLQHK